MLVLLLTWVTFGLWPTSDAGRPIKLGGHITTQKRRFAELQEVLIKRKVRNSASLERSRGRFDPPYGGRHVPDACGSDGWKDGTDRRGFVFRSYKQADVARARVVIRRAGG